MFQLLLLYKPRRRELYFAELVFEWNSIFASLFRQCAERRREPSLGVRSSIHLLNDSALSASLL